MATSCEETPRSRQAVAEPHSAIEEGARLYIRIYQVRAIAGLSMATLSRRLYRFTQSAPPSL
ncbi:MAG: hypothetical protein ACLFU6_08625 [Candidatus Hydrogenedentota bacterium]